MSSLPVSSSRDSFVLSIARRPPNTVAFDDWENQQVTPGLAFKIVPFDTSRDQYTLSKMTQLDFGRGVLETLLRDQRCCFETFIQKDQEARKPPPPIRVIYVCSKWKEQFDKGKFVQTRDQGVTAKEIMYREPEQISHIFGRLLVRVDAVRSDIWTGSRLLDSDLLEEAECDMKVIAGAAPSSAALVRASEMSEAAQLKYGTAAASPASAAAALAAAAPVSTPVPAAAASPAAPVAAGSAASFSPAALVGPPKAAPSPASAVARPKVGSSLLESKDGRKPSPPPSPLRDAVILRRQLMPGRRLWN